MDPSAAAANGRLKHSLILLMVRLVVSLIVAAGVARMLRYQPRTPIPPGLFQEDAFS